MPLGGIRDLPSISAMSQYSSWHRIHLPACLQTLPHLESNHFCVCKFSRDCLCCIPPIIGSLFAHVTLRRRHKGLVYNTFRKVESRVWPLSFLERSPLTVGVDFLCLSVDSPSLPLAVPRRSRSTPSSPGSSAAWPPCPASDTCRSGR